MRRHFALLLLGLLGLSAALAAIPARADDDEHAAEVSAAAGMAAHWLDALDAGEYEKTWKDVAAVMREGRNQEEWISDIAEPRAKLGKAIMRELQHADFAATVRGAPKGNYVTTRYLSQFAETPPLLETILLTLEDGNWRIAGYNVVAAPSPAQPSTPPSPPSPAPPAPPADKAGKGAAAKPKG